MDRVVCVGKVVFRKEGLGEGFEDAARMADLPEVLRSHASSDRLHDRLAQPLRGDRGPANLARLSGEETCPMRKNGSRQVPGYRSMACRRVPLLPLRPGWAPGGITRVGIRLHQRQYTGPSSSYNGWN